MINQEKELEAKARKIRKNILDIISKSNSSHIGSALSSVDILTALYFKVLNINPKKINDDRDRFILSKGHSVSALYSTLYEKGFFDKERLEKFCCNGSSFPGHPYINPSLGIEATTGALGHGLSIGAGIALSGKNDNKKYRVFVLLGDGECNEGSVWEAAMFASQHKLDNLIVIIDNNKLQGLGECNQIIDLEPFEKKWQAFGWNVKRINGHNFKEILNALKKIPFGKNKPNIIIADTIKGKGISFMENKCEWHYKSPNQEQYNQAVKELK